MKSMRSLFRPLIFAALAVAAVMLGAMPPPTVSAGSPVAVAAAVSHDAIVVARADQAVSPIEIRPANVTSTTYPRTPVATATLMRADYRGTRLVHIDPGRSS